jgi:hypothetical protein
MRANRPIFQQVRLSEAEHQALTALAIHMRRTISDILRSPTDPVLLDEVCRAVDALASTGGASAH